MLGSLSDDPQGLLQQLQATTGINWHILDPVAMRLHSVMQHMAVLYLCASKNCAQGIYVVPADNLTYAEYYQLLLQFVARYGYQLMPTIKCDINKFPQVVLPPHAYLNNMLIITLKFAGQLVLRPEHSFNPLHYTLGGLASIKTTASYTVQSYLTGWSLKAILLQNANVLEISLTHVITNESASASLTWSGNCFSGTISALPVKTQWANWLLEGEISISLTGEINNNPSQPLLPATMNDQHIQYEGMIALLLLGSFAGACLLTEGAALALFGAAAMLP